MIISFSNKLGTLLRMLAQIRFLPSSKRLKTLIKPLEATRFIEFTYIIKYLNTNVNCIKSGCKILDISSPFLLSYYLSKKAEVIKTDINFEEASYIKQGDKLAFHKADATRLNYISNSFDLVYSISVIEHIYNDYLTAIKEMTRVTKVGGLVYLTFPVACKHSEEWLDTEIYSDQIKSKDKTFFQYRFDKADIELLKSDIKEHVTIEKEDIYWEPKNGTYDRLTKRLRKKSKPAMFFFLKNTFWNYFYGLFVFKGKPSDFENCKEFGNIHLILKKK